MSRSTHILCPVSRNTYHKRFAIVVMLVLAGIVSAGITGSTDSHSSRKIPKSQRNSVTGGWTSTGDMDDPRIFHTATMLLNWKVLVAGRNGTSLPSTTIFEPSTNQLR